MLIPKRTKYRKQHRPVRRGMSKGGNEIAFGDFLFGEQFLSDISPSASNRIRSRPLVSP